MALTPIKRLLEALYAELLRALSANETASAAMCIEYGALETAASRHGAMTRAVEINNEESIALVCGAIPPHECAMYAAAAAAAGHMGILQNLYLTRDDLVTAADFALREEQVKPLRWMFGLDPTLRIDVQTAAMAASDIAAARRYTAFVRSEATATAVQCSV